MRTMILRTLVAFALLGTGWVAAKAQTPNPDFELIVDAPVGATTITCLRGCGLMWIERGIPSNSSTMRTFQFRCSDSAERCSSSRVGGWLTP